jgi:glycyl-tRNA synthetase
MRVWFFDKMKFSRSNIREYEVPKSDRAHYSKRTIDFEYKYPIGFKEIAGFAYRTDFDLQNHQKYSGKSMEFIPKNGGKPIIPHVLEPTFGVDRHVLAVLSEAYTIDEINGEKRIFLGFPYHLAPIKAAVSPLLKNKPELVEKAKEVYTNLRRDISSIMWDDNGNIGKRYRRQDEIGTPYCITIDFDTIKDDTVTVRDRNTTEQKRVKTKDLLQSVNEGS